MYLCIPIGITSCEQALVCTASVRASLASSLGRLALAGLAEVTYPIHTWTTSQRTGQRSMLVLLFPTIPAKHPSTPTQPKGPSKLFGVILAPTGQQSILEQTYPTQPTGRAQQHILQESYYCTQPTGPSSHVGVTLPPTGQAQVSVSFSFPQVQRKHPEDSWSTQGTAETSEHPNHARRGTQHTSWHALATLMQRTSVPHLFSLPCGT